MMTTPESDMNCSWDNCFRPKQLSSDFCGFHAIRSYAAWIRTHDLSPQESVSASLKNCEKLRNCDTATKNVDNHDPVPLVCERISAQGLRSPKNIVIDTEGPEQVNLKTNFSGQCHSVMRIESSLDLRSVKKTVPVYAEGRCEYNAPSGSSGVLNVTTSVGIVDGDRIQPVSRTSVSKQKHSDGSQNQNALHTNGGSSCIERKSCYQHESLQSGPVISEKSSVTSLRVSPSSPLQRSTQPNGGINPLSPIPPSTQLSRRRHGTEKVSINTGNHLWQVSLSRDSGACLEQKSTPSSDSQEIKLGLLPSGDTGKVTAARAPQSLKGSDTFTPEENETVVVQPAVQNSFMHPCISHEMVISSMNCSTGQRALQNSDGNRGVGYSEECKAPSNVASLVHQDQSSIQENFATSNGSAHVRAPRAPLLASEVVGRVSQVQSQHMPIPTFLSSTTQQSIRSESAPDYIIVQQQNNNTVLVKTEQVGDIVFTIKTEKPDSEDWDALRSEESHENEFSNCEMLEIPKICSVPEKEEFQETQSTSSCENCFVSSRVTSSEAKTHVQQNLPLHLISSRNQEMPAHLETHTSGLYAGEHDLLLAHCLSLTKNMYSLLQYVEEDFTLRRLLNYCPDPVCDFNSFSSEEVLQHLAFSHPLSGNFICWKCSSHFSYLQNFASHIKQNTVRVFQCPRCSTRDTNHRTVLAHIASSHPGIGRMVCLKDVLLCQESRPVTNYTESNDQESVIVGVPSTSCRNQPVTTNASHLGQFSQHVSSALPEKKEEASWKKASTFPLPRNMVNKHVIEIDRAESPADLEGSTLPANLDEAKELHQHTNATSKQYEPKELHQRSTSSANQNESKGVHLLQKQSSALIKLEVDTVKESSLSKLKTIKSNSAKDNQNDAVPPKALSQKKRKLQRQSALSPSSKKKKSIVPLKVEPAWDAGQGHNGDVCENPIIKSCSVVLEDVLRTKKKTGQKGSGRGPFMHLTGSAGRSSVRRGVNGTDQTGPRHRISENIKVFKLESRECEYSCKLCSYVFIRKKGYGHRRAYRRIWMHVFKKHVYKQSSGQSKTDVDRSQPKRGVYGSGLKRNTGGGQSGRKADASLLQREAVGTQSNSEGENGISKPSRETHHSASGQSVREKGVDQSKRVSQAKRKLGGSHSPKETISKQATLHSVSGARTLLNQTVELSGLVDVKAKDNKPTLTENSGRTGSFGMCSSVFTRNIYATSQPSGTTKTNIVSAAACKSERSSFGASTSTEKQGEDVATIFNVEEQIETDGSGFETVYTCKLCPFTVAKGILQHAYAYRRIYMHVVMNHKPKIHDKGSSIGVVKDFKIVSCGKDKRGASCNHCHYYFSTEKMTYRFAYAKMYKHVSRKHRTELEHRTSSTPKRRKN